MDYNFVITPGALCVKCENSGLVINTTVGTLIKCQLYGAVNENNQAQHCINYWNRDDIDHPKVEE